MENNINKDFTYCNGKGCALKEHCVRHLSGLRVPKDVSGYWWMECCDEETRNGYINNLC